MTQTKAFLASLSPHKKENLRPFRLLLSSNPYEHIHYSWYYQPLQHQPASIQSLFISSLPPTQQKELNKMFKLSSTKNSSFINNFVFHSLLKEIQKPGVLPLPFLPSSELHLLLKIKPNELTHLTDLLGIYDLAAEYKQIIDQSLLKKIESALKEDEYQFLLYVTKQPIKWIPPKLHLPQWNGEKETLRRLIHQRGLARLAKATLKEDPSFQWHLLHRLDTGRAKIIEKSYSQKLDPILIPYFKSQVIDIAKRYKS